MTITATISAAPRSAPAGAGGQLSFDELDEPLSATTFVVVDLETTGGSPERDAITEIGAVKVRGGEILGEFATLIDPGRAIPPQIVELTGITTAMVRAAPTIDAVLPSFLEFARGSVLVAHNARFDMAFLKSAAGQLAQPWPAARTLCTVRLARRVLSRQEAPSVRLSALATLLNVTQTPTHRALDDARATVEVLHRLIERVGNQGVHSYSELVDYLPDVSPAQRAKRRLAQHLPSTPGVYLFRGPSDEVLYVGTAVDLRRRVRSYFTGSESRGRIKEMVALSTRVDHVECAHGLEAAVRELRLIHAHEPAYNRRSKYPRRAWWITVTEEAFPRLSVTRTPGPDALGPFRVRADAVEVAVTVARACELRTCTRRIGARGSHGPECGRGVLDACPATADAPEGADAYAPRAERVRRLLRGLHDEPLELLRADVERRAEQLLFESAARKRDRLVALARAARRTQRLAALAAIEQLVAARPDGGGGWEFAVVRHGRLASAGVARRGTHPMPVVDALVAAAETVIPDGTPLRGAPVEEIALIVRWLDSGGVRLVRSSQGYAEPCRGAGRWTSWCDAAADSAAAPTPTHTGGSAAHRLAAAPVNHSPVATPL